MFEEVKNDFIEVKNDCIYLLCSLLSRQKFNWTMMLFNYLHRGKCLKINNDMHVEFISKLNMLDKFTEINVTIYREITNWPANVRTIIFDRWCLSNHDNCFKMINRIPHQITTIRVSCKNYICHSFPDKLVSFDCIISDYSDKFDRSHSFIPETLETLKLYINFDISNFERSIEDLPNGIVSLELGQGFQTKIPYLPKSLTELILPHTYHNFTPKAKGNWKVEIESDIDLRNILHLKIGLLSLFRDTEIKDLSVFCLYESRHILQGYVYQPRRWNEGVPFLDMCVELFKNNSLI